VKKKNITSIQKETYKKDKHKEAPHKTQTEPPRENGGRGFEKYAREI